jgi:rhodanese-related sulfurtransferase
VSLFARRSVSVTDAHEAAGNGAVLIDVRSAGEWNHDGRAEGAQHIPLPTLPQKLERLRGNDVLVICRSGNRSARAAALLRRNGIPALNVRGGMIAWRRHGLPMGRETRKRTTR